MKKQEHVTDSPVNRWFVIAALFVLSGPILSGILGSWLPGLATILATTMLQLFAYSRLEPYDKNDNTV